MKKIISLVSGLFVLAIITLLSAPFFIGRHLQANLPRLQALLKNDPQTHLLRFKRHWFSSELFIQFHHHVIPIQIQHGPIIFHDFEQAHRPLFALAFGRAAIDSPTLTAQIQSVLHFNHSLHTVGTASHFILKQYHAIIQINQAIINLYSNLNTAKTTGTIHIAATAQLNNKQQLQATFYRNLSTEQENLKLIIPKTDLVSWLSEKTDKPSALLSTLEKIKYLHPTTDQKNYIVDINLQNNKTNS